MSSETSEHTNAAAHKAEPVQNEKAAVTENETAAGARMEEVKTNERVPGHGNYYEKDGLRTYGDDQDHDHEPPLTFRRFMSLVAMAFLWTGSQIPVYLYGAVPPYIYGDIGGVDRWTWFIIANLLSLAAMCPFVGSLSDLIGRRYVAILGASLLILGNIIAATAHTMNTFIGGHVFMGIGAGINELTALAATSEMAPTRKRGVYVAVLVFTILPFCPSVLWGQLIASHGSWRYIGLFCGLWAFIGLVTVAIFYFPPPRVNSAGLTRREVVAQIDFGGGFLSIVGMILFMMGLQWGGNQYSWRSAHTLVPLLLGGVMIIAFFIYEAKFAPYPMLPRRLRQNPRILGLTLFITWISGANFFAIIMFWPTQAFNVYGHDPIGVGIRGIPIGFSILAGACIWLVALSVLRGQIRLLMVAATCIMTAGIGSMAIANVNDMYKLYGLLVLAGLGIGGIVVPASIITTIICPDDLIATVASLTLAIRVIGGVIGYCVYYNVFVEKFKPKVIDYVGGAMIHAGVFNQTYITDAIQLTAASLIQELKAIPGLQSDTAYNAVVLAGRTAYAEAYRYVYLVSIPFGVASIIAALCLGDITKYMDDHVAVVIA